MRLNSIVWLILIGLGLSSFVKPAAAQATFEDFLSKANPCGGSAAYSKFIDSLRDRYYYDKSSKKPLTLPESIREKFGEPKAKNEGDWTHIIVPINDAKYYNLSVVEFDLFLGNDNGILILNTVFSDNLKFAREQLGGLVKKSNKKFKRDRAAMSSSDTDFVSLRSHKKGSELNCDLST